MGECNSCKGTGRVRRGKLDTKCRICGGTGFFRLDKDSGQVDRPQPKASPLIRNQFEYIQGRRG